MNIIKEIKELIHEIEYPDNSIILYHYSENKYKELKTLNLQNKKLPNSDTGYKFRSDPAPYEDHVSLFLEPPPFDLLPEIFPKNHHIWVKGNKFIEHQIDINNIDLFAWKLIETDLDTFFANNLWIENDIYKYLFFRLRKTLKSMIGESGTDISFLIKLLKKIPDGITRQKYLEFKNSKNYEENKYKYAATVPHLFVYTYQPIKVSGYRNIVL